MSLSAKLFCHHIQAISVFVSFILLCNVLNAQLTYNELSVQYDSPWTFKKLQLIPVRFKDKGDGSAANVNAFINPVISFAEALKQRKIIIKENSGDGGADVSTLMVKNKSKDNVLLLSGDMVQGGKQDRAFGKTIIIPPGKGKNYVPVFCIEKGRWDDRTRPFKHAGTADAGVRKQIDVTQRQSKIWKQIDNELASKNKKNQTSAYLKAYNDSTIDDTSYLHFFVNKMKQSDSAYAGFVAITGSRIINSEIFAGSDLCLSAYIDLIKSYVHSIQPVDETPSKTRDAIKTFTDKFLPNKTIQKKYLSTNGRMYYYNSEVIHLVAYD